MKIEVAYETLNEKIIKKDLFKETKFFYLIGYIYSIQNDLFQNYKSLKSTILRCDSANNDLKWIESLNKDVYISSLNQESFNIDKAVYLIVKEQEF